MWPVVSFFFLPVVSICKSEEIPCSINQTQNGTFYSVPEIPASDCLYQWINSSEFVIADNEEKIDHMVLSSNPTVLQTKKCHVLMKYSRDCPSEGGKRTTTCAINCTSSAPPQKGGENGHHFDWTVWIVAALLLIGVVMIVTAGLCLKFRPRCSRRYARTNQQDNNADVEARGVEMVDK